MGKGTCHSTKDHFRDDEGNLHIYKYDDFGAHLKTPDDEALTVKAGKTITFEYRNRGLTALALGPTHQVFLLGSCSTVPRGSCERGSSFWKDANNIDGEGCPCTAKERYDSCEVLGRKDFNRLPQDEYKAMPSTGGKAFEYLGGAQKIVSLFSNQVPDWENDEFMPKTKDGKPDRAHGAGGVTTYTVPNGLSGQTLYFACAIANAAGGGCTGGIRRKVKVD